MTNVQRELNAREKKFVNHYVTNACNGTLAATKAGYKSTVAAQMSSRLLKRAHVKSEIERLLSEQHQSLDFTYKYSSNALRTIVERFAADETVKVTARDAIAAIAEINKMFGFYAPAQTENKHALIMSDKDSDMKDMIKSFESTLKKFERDV